MQGGLPMRNIAWTQAVIVVALIALAIVAVLVHDESIADTIVGGVFGVIVGGTATTVVVQQAVTKANDAAAAEAASKQ